MKVIQEKAFQMIVEAAVCSSTACGTEFGAAKQNMIFLQAGPGLGKSYLLRAVECHLTEEVQGNAAKVKYIIAEDFISELIYAYREGTVKEFLRKYGELAVLLVDDVESLEGKEATQEAFLDILGQIRRTDGTVVFAGTKIPELLEGCSWNIIELEAPDADGRMEILRGKAEQLGISVEKEIFHRIAERFADDVRMMGGALTRIAAYADLMDRDLNMELTEEVLAEFEK